LPPGALSRASLYPLPGTATDRGSKPSSESTTAPQYQDQTSGLRNGSQYPVLAGQSRAYRSGLDSSPSLGDCTFAYIQRSEAGKPGDFSDLSDEELRAKIKAYGAIDKAKDTTYGQVIELPKRDH